MKRWSVGILPVLCLAVVLCLFTSGCTRPTPAGNTVLRIPNTRFMGILPLYVAEEKDFFKNQGITIQWIDVKDPGQGAKLFFAGRADLLMTTFANVIEAEARKPGTIRLLYPIYESQSPPGSFLLVSPTSKIRTVRDLKGKTVGTYSGPSQKAYALIVLKKLGFDVPGEVRLVQVPSSAQIQGLFGGSYDALFTVETYGSIAISKGARVIDSSVRTKYISNPFWLGSVALPTSLVKQKPQVSKDILSALGNAAKYIAEHPVEAREILARRTNTDKSVAERCALYTWVAHPNDVQIKQIQAHVDLLYAEKLIPTRIVVADILEGASK